MGTTFKDFPMWILTDMEAQFDKVQGKQGRALIEDVRAEFEARYDEILQSPLKAPVTIDGYAVIVQVLTTPSGKKIAIYTFNDKSEKLFVDVQQLALAINYHNPDAVTSSTSEFYQCFQLSANFYKVNAPPRVVQNKLFVDVKDVPQFLDNYIRYLADEYDDYVVVKELADFWSTAAFRYTVKSSTEPTEKQMVDKFSAYFGIPRDKVIHFILEQREAEFKRSQAKFKDLSH